MSFIDEFNESCHCVLWLIVRSVEFLDIRLKDGSVLSNVSREEFDHIFDCVYTIIWKVSAMFNFINIEVFAFDIPFLKKFRDILVIELH